MKILLCPDKFKGSLTADEVCESMERGIHRCDSSIEVVKLPLADGGEGTLDVLETSLSLNRVSATVKDPLLRPVSTYYLQNKTQAFIEMASASGLELLKAGERNPLITSTYGTGELIKHALESDVEEIYLLIGGSATNDGGTGMAEALGYRFETMTGHKVSPGGQGLLRITKVDRSETYSRINGVRFTVLSDVRNVLLGPEGASHVYGPQKGADSESVKLLDTGLAALSALLNNGFEEVPGAGAAGGLGYGAMSFLNARILPGIEVIMDIVNFREQLEGADLVLTGEGKLDAQTMAGKVISGVTEAVKEKNIPIGIICGVIDGTAMSMKDKGVFTILPLLEEGMDLDYAIRHAAELVESKTFEFIKGFTTKAH